MMSSTPILTCEPWPDADSLSTITALTCEVRNLPVALRPSITWDRGKEACDGTMLPGTFKETRDWRAP
jgi:IS30 family transposase